MPNAQPEVTIEERPASVGAEPPVQDRLRGALEHELAATGDGCTDTDGRFMFSDGPPFMFSDGTG